MVLLMSDLINMLNISDLYVYSKLFVYVLCG
jgi:hypothetical protein